MNGQANGKPLLSVVIPTHQRREALRRTLQGLARQSLDRGCYEIVVSVDGSHDGTCEMLAQMGIRCVEQAEAGGPGAARNRGASVNGRAANRRRPQRSLPG